MHPFGLNYAEVHAEFTNSLIPCTFRQIQQTAPHGPLAVRSVCALKSVAATGKA